MLINLNLSQNMRHEIRHNRRTEGHVVFNLGDDIVSHKIHYSENFSSQKIEGQGQEILVDKRNLEIIGTATYRARHFVIEYVLLAVGPSPTL